MCFAEMSRATGLFPSVKAEPAAQSVCAPFSTSDDDDACLSFSRGRQFPREEEATAQTGSGSARPSRAPLWTRLFSRAVGGFSAQAAPGTLRLRLGLCLPRLPSKLGFAPSSPETSLLERPSALAGDLRREALASAPVEASSSPSEKSLSHRLSKSSDAERPNKGALSLAPQRRRPKELVVPLRGAADPVVSGQLSAETSRGEEDCCHSSPSLFGRKEKALVGVRHPKARVPLRAQGSRCLECCVQSIPRLCRLPRAAEGAAARLARDWAAEDSERWAAARDRALKWAEAESGGAVMQLLGDLQVLARELLGIARWAATRAFQERLAAAPEGRPNSEGDNKALFADASSRLCRDAQKATARASLLAASLSGGQQHRLRPNAGFARRGFLGVTTQRRVSLWLRAEDATNGVLNSEAERLMRWSLLFQVRKASVHCPPTRGPLARKTNPRVHCCFSANRRKGRTLFAARRFSLLRQKAQAQQGRVFVFAGTAWRPRRNCPEASWPSFRLLPPPKAGPSGMLRPEAGEEGCRRCVFDWWNHGLKSCCKASRCKRLWHRPPPASQKRGCEEGRKAESEAQETREPESPSAAALTLACARLGRC